MQQSEFDTATALESLGDGRYSGAVHPGWDINGNANGGYLLALAAQAMRSASGRPDPVTVTAHYLSPAPAGPVEARTEVVKEGRRFATVSGSLRQGDRELIRVLGTFGDLSRTAGDAPLLTREQPPDLPPYESSPPRGDGNGPDVPVALMGRLGVRLHPDDARFQQGIRSGTPEIRGWFAFADERPIDTLALLLAADAFPPTVFNLDIAPGWVPTVELTVHVRGIPSPGPLRCRFATRFLQHGFFEEDGEIWDSSGQLVAQSRQLALAPLSPPPG